jgi:hypothetical protein
VATALELRERPRRRGGLRGLGGQLRVVVAAAHAVHLLGRVDEQEVERERARGHGAGLERQRLDPCQQGLELAGRRLTAPPRPACLAQLLERGPQPPHVLLQRLVFGAVVGRG